MRLLKSVTYLVCALHIQTHREKERKSKINFSQSACISKIIECDLIKPPMKSTHSGKMRLKLLKKFLKLNYFDFQFRFILINALALT